MGLNPEFVAKSTTGFLARQLLEGRDLAVMGAQLGFSQLSEAGRLQALGLYFIYIEVGLTVESDGQSLSPLRR